MTVLPEKKRVLRFRKIKRLAHSHTAREGQVLVANEQNQNPVHGLLVQLLSIVPLRFLQVQERRPWMSPVWA